MNRLKTAVYNKLSKQIVKAIKHVKRTFLSPESLKDQDEFTLKELKKKFPNSYRSNPCKMKKPLCKKGSKGTKKTPSCHVEDKRWIQNGTKQMKTQRAVINHHGGIKK